MSNFKKYKDIEKEIDVLVRKLDLKKDKLAKQQQNSMIKALGNVLLEGFTVSARSSTHMVYLYFKSNRTSAKIETQLNVLRSNSFSIFAQIGNCIGVEEKSKIDLLIETAKIAQFFKENDAQLVNKCKNAYNGFQSFTETLKDISDIEQEMSILKHKKDEIFSQSLNEWIKHCLTNGCEVPNLLHEVLSFKVLKFNPTNLVLEVKKETIMNGVQTTTTNTSRDLVNRRFALFAKEHTEEMLKHRDKALGKQVLKEKLEAL